jgi:hypothetical protein
MRLGALFREAKQPVYEVSLKMNESLPYFLSYMTSWVVKELYLLVCVSIKLGISAQGKNTGGAF